MNITKTEKVLKFIIDNPGCDTVNISTYFNVTNQTARKYLKYLKADGFIQVSCRLTFLKGRPVEIYYTRA